MSLAYYYTLQNEARRRVQHSLNKRIVRSGGMDRWDGLTLCSIVGSGVGDALDFATNEWPKYYGTSTHLGFSQSWEHLVHKFLPDHDHFNLAIWQKHEEKQILVAMALGAPSKRHKYLTVKWVERYWGPNRLAGRALWPILACAEEYAKLLGSNKVLIKDPVDQSKYQRYGYKVFSHPGVAFGGNYLGKDMKDG